jgi:5-hydroxyisourate hydrolase-like protein (transthyretin family)
MKILCALVLCLFAFTVNAVACMCGGPGRPCQAYWDASAVFVGTVTFGTTINVKEAGYEVSKRLVRLHVDRAIRNIDATDVEVMTGLGDSDCGFGFRLGGQYMVYAYGEGGALSTSICTRTRLLSKATADLAYIEGLSKAPPGGTISGQVFLRRPSRGEEYPLPPAKDVKIVLNGPGKQFERKTDAEGKYSVSGLPPGTYKITVDPPPGLSIYKPEVEVTVVDRGCREAFFEVEPDTQLTGKVVDAQGMAAADVLLELVPVTREIGNYPGPVRTDKEGRFVMRLLKPSRYYLGVRIAGSAGSTYVPYPQTYYPGVKERSQATAITVIEGQRVDLDEFILPPRFIERTLTGIVVDPEGKPVAGAVVWLKERQYNDGDMPYRRETDSEGRFSYPVYEGIKYSLTANVDSAEERLMESAPFEVVITSTPEPVKLVLEKRKP